MTVLDIKRMQAARSLLMEILPPTPLLRSQEEKIRGTVWLKCENVQPTGSFKIRGATYKISRLTASQRRAGVIAYSTGNHAQAVAKAAADAGVESTIVMSPDVPDYKVEATRSWGGRVTMAEPSSASRRTAAELLADETGAVLIPPYNDLDVMAGQASISFELAAQYSDFPSATIYVPIGGGGLIAGIAAAAKALAPTCRVVGVEPELEDDAARSFRAGEIIHAAGPSMSIADAIKVQALGELTFPTICAFVDDIVTVTEDETRLATLELYRRQHLVVEPGGAIGYAVARREAKACEGAHIGLLCGGNISIERLNALTQAVR